MRPRRPLCAPTGRDSHQSYAEDMACFTEGNYIAAFQAAFHLVRLFPGRCPGLRNNGTLGLLVDLASLRYANLLRSFLIHKKWIGLKGRKGWSAAESQPEPGIATKGRKDHKEEIRITNRGEKG